jgi:hypothetical protein
MALLRYAFKLKMAKTLQSKPLETLLVGNFIGAQLSPRSLRIANPAARRLIDRN